MNDDQGDKFIVSSQGTVCSQCGYCTHLIKGGLPVCDAFPGWIPDGFMTNTIDHRKPYDGDQGVQFEPRPEVPWNVLTQLYDVLDKLPSRPV